MITANDIETKVFERSVMGGYKPEDVDEFLDNVTADFKELSDENADLIKKISVLVKKIEEYQQDDEYLKKAIIAAQKSTEVAETQAKEKASSIIEEAKLNANEIIENAKREAEIIITNANNAYEIEKAKIDNEISSQKSVLEETKKEVSDFRTKILELYTEHFEIINKIPQMAKNELKKIEPLTPPKPEKTSTDTAMEMPVSKVTSEPSQSSDLVSDNNTADKDSLLFDIQDDTLTDTDELELEQSSEFSLVSQLEIDDKKEKSNDRFSDLRFGVDYDIND